MVKIQCTGSQCNVLRGLYMTAGSANVYEAEFVFNDAWDGFAKTAIWSNGTIVTPIVLDITNTCIIPQEVLSVAGVLSIGIYGIKGNQILKSSIVGISKVVSSVEMSLVPGLDPTPEAYQQISNMMEQAIEATQTILTTEADRLISESQRVTAENQREQNESDRRTSELQRNTSETNRNSSENNRISAESQRATNETARQSAEGQRDLNEQARVIAEGSRADVEDLRVLAETNRNEQEELRNTSEGIRESAESERISNENTRKSSENSRISSETGRSTAESLRVTAENQRVLAETNRNAAETERSNTEIDRNSAEELRITNENTRASNELLRESAEDDRAATELLRVSAEDIRVSTENSRKNAEANRSNAENDRVSNETARGNAETNRVNNESLRGTAEGNRTSAETLRVNAETGRVNAETTRGTNESNRVTAEQGRVNAEVLRVTAENSRQATLDAKADKTELIGTNISLTDAGSHFATKNAEAALQQVAGKINTLTADYNKRLSSIDPFAIFGVSWNKTSNPTLNKTDSAIHLTSNVGVDSNVVANDFDKALIWGEMKEVTDSFGNVFIRIPKCYIKKTDTENLKTWQVSKTKYKGFYLPWCFWDFEKNKELDYIDVGKYKASLSVDSKLESKPNKYPLISETIVNFRTYAQDNGAGYQQLDIHVVDLLQTLFIIEQGTLHSQSKVAGYTSGQYTNTHLALIAEVATNRIVVTNAQGALYEVGQAISVGTSQGGNQVFYGRTIVEKQTDTPSAGQTSVIFDGDTVNIAIGNCLYNTGYKNGFSKNIESSVGSINSNTSGKHPFVWHGIESLYGDVGQIVDGMNINENQAWVCKDASKYASNLFTAPYEQLSYVNSNANGYAKAMGFDENLPFAEFPVDVTGGSTTYYSDYYYQATGQRIARFGGFWLGGAGAGLFYWYLNYSSSGADVAIGGRLLKKPL